MRLLSSAPCASAAWAARAGRVCAPLPAARAAGGARPRIAPAPRPAAKRSLLTQSYGRGSLQPPLLEQTIPQHFDWIVDRHGDRPAVIAHQQDQSVTYGELQARSNAVARGLQGLGVQKGDRVAISMGNCMEFAVLTYAIFRLGAVLVPLNPAFTPPQVVSALTHLSASHLITGAEQHLPYRPPRPNLPLIQALVDDPSASTLKSSAVPSLKHIVVQEALPSASSSIFDAVKCLTPYKALESHQSTAPNVDKLHNDEVVNIQFTSGTTSMPKAAMLTHRNILNNGFNIGEGLALTEQDVISCPPPLFHCFGCILGYMATATHGSAILFPSPAFDPKAVLEATAKFRATGLYGVPTMFLASLALLATGTLKLPEDGFSRLRTGIAAGSSVPAEVMRKLHRTLNLSELAICYGMTETSPVSCMTTAADPLEKRVETVGKLAPHVRAKVVDPETRATLAIGERGELAVSGYLVMKGYWGDEAKTREALVEMEDGGERRTWMMTGDEASMDAEGYVRITGRIKDLIIRGGENVHPLEVEDCLLGMDAVSDVSVVGVKDAHYGEVVGAFVIRAAGDGGGQLQPDAVRQWVRDRLSKHLVPRYVFFVDTLPKTASGKVQKFALREQAEDLVKSGGGE